MKSNRYKLPTSLFTVITLAVCVHSAWCADSATYPSFLATSVSAVTLHGASLAQFRDDVGRKAHVPICFEFTASDIALLSRPLISLVTTNTQTLSDLIGRLNMTNPHLHFSCVEGVILCRTKAARALTNSPMDIVGHNFRYNGSVGGFVSTLVRDTHILTSVRQPSPFYRSVDIEIPSGLTLREALGRLAMRHSIEWSIVVDPALVQNQWMRMALDFGYPPWPLSASIGTHHRH